MIYPEGVQAPSRTVGYSHMLRECQLRECQVPVSTAKLSRILPCGGGTSVVLLHVCEVLIDTGSGYSSGHHLQQYHSPRVYLWPELPDVPSASVGCHCIACGVLCCPGRVRTRRITILQYLGRARRSDQTTRRYIINTHDDGELVPRAQRGSEAIITEGMTIH